MVSVSDVFRTVATLVQAGTELIRAEAGGLLPTAIGLESISRTAGEAYRDAGVVGSVDEGIVLFHQQVTADKPGLRRILRKIDERAGRRKRRGRTRLQSFNDRVMRTAPRLRKDVKLKLTAAQKAERKKIIDDRNKAALKRLGVRR